MAQPLDDLLAKFTPQDTLDRDAMMFTAGQQTRSVRGWKLAVAGLCLSQLMTLGILAVVLIGGSENPTGPTVKTPIIWEPLDPNVWEPLEVSPPQESHGYSQPYATAPMIPDDPPLFAGATLAKHLDQ